MKYLILMVVMAIVYYAVWVIKANDVNENEAEMRINNLNQNKILSLLG